MDGSNTPDSGLDSAIARLMGQTSDVEDPAGATETDEATQETEPVKSEDVVRTPQSPKVDSKDQPAVDKLTEGESPDPDGEEEEEPEEDEEAEESEDTEDAEETEEEAEDNEPETVFQLDDGTEVDLDELKRGYLRQSDYTKKTQEVAEHRKTLEQVNAQYLQAQNTLAENLDLALRVVEPQLAELAGTDWDALAREDAYQYAEKRAQFDQAQSRYNKLMQSAQAVVQQQKAQQGQQMKQRLAQEGEKLRMALPDFADPSKAKALKGKITEYAMSKAGLSENEAKGITDHRMILLLHKAMQFDELSEGSLTAARKKVSKAPKKSIRSGKPTSREQKAADAQKQARSRLKQTGSEADAISLLLGQ